MFLLFAAKRVSNFFAATWTKSNCSLKPMLATTLSSLQERGKAALKHFTEGQVMHVLTVRVWGTTSVSGIFLMLRSSPNALRCSARCCSSYCS